MPRLFCYIIFVLTENIICGLKDASCRGGFTSEGRVEGGEGGG